MSLRFGAPLLGPLAAPLARRLYFLPPPSTQTEATLGQEFRFAAGGEEIQGWSRGVGPTILLVHGWGGSASQFNGLGTELVDAGYRVVALDMPGHGRSTGSVTSFLHFARAIEQVQRLVGPLEGIVAHSLGAAGVQVALWRGLRVPRVVFLAPFAHIDTFVERFAAACRLDEATTTGMVRDGERWLGVSFEEIAPLRLAQQLDTPLLVLHSDNDRMTPIEESRQLAAAWRGAQHVCLPGLGHNRLLRDAGVHERIGRFLRQEPLEIPAEERRALFERPSDEELLVGGSW
ncbi:MAG: alpha/beta fold hydrolase [Verrucomicrobia bacterium]|nr:alpha/beta fold hydrolase [Verrucomicrobiota bacterium]